jgi:hypothetical protein
MSIHIHRNCSLDLKATISVATETLARHKKTKCLLFRQMVPMLNVFKIGVNWSSDRTIAPGIVAGSPPRPRFETRSGHVGFVVDKVALGQVFSQYFDFPCQFSFHRLLHTHHLSSGAGTTGQLVAGVPSGLSLTPPQETTKLNGSSERRNKACLWNLITFSFFIPH